MTTLSPIAQILIIIAALAFARVAYLLIDSRRKRAVRDAWIRRVIGEIEVRP